MVDHVVVTGDRGFIGERLRRRLLRDGLRVSGLDARPAAREPDEMYRPQVLDLADPDAVRGFFQSVPQATTVFHLAARLSVTDDDPLLPHLHANLKATQNILAALDGRGIPLVLSSTMSVFGRPPSRLPVQEDEMPTPAEAYGLTKFAAECCVERMARMERVPAVILRYSGVFGLGYEYGAINYYASRFLAGLPVSVYGHGRTVRDYVHVDDVVVANLLAARALRDRKFGLYHIGGGSPLPLVQLARLTAAAVGSGQIETDGQPAPFDFAFDIRRAATDLGYAPLPLEDRIGQFVVELKGRLPAPEEQPDPPA
jgi:UDP-glucose 4-epimerase